MLPKLWGDDLLFPYIARFSGVVPPAGCIYRVDPDGKNWELWSAGYRNPYDAAFNRHGDLFTFDSDMEWDMNTPWYRLTRVCMAASGSDFGFRNGSNVSPPRYPDTLPAIADIGPGSPTGVTFGYGAKFPAKYQEAFFICDWSYGRLFAVHLTPDGSAYKAQFEEFATGAPLALTDVVVNPRDGALYFTVGGRNTQSALYRIAYTGKESTAPSKGDDTGAEARALRHKLEAFHGKADSKAVQTVWPYLGHEDRYLRFAARTAIEHQPHTEWQDLALQERKPVAAIHALLALARSAGKDPAAGAGLKESSILGAARRLDWSKLTDSQERCDLVRVYTVLFSRLGKPDEAARANLIKTLAPVFPTKKYELNADLCQLLVYLEAPSIASQALQLIARAPSQEEQMEYVLSLRNLKTGWTLPERKEFFGWFAKAANYKGGQRFQQYVTEMRQSAVATLTTEEKEALKTVLAAKKAAPEFVAKPRPLVRQWTLDELAPIVDGKGPRASARLRPRPPACSVKPSASLATATTTKAGALEAGPRRLSPAALQPYPRFPRKNHGAQQGDQRPVCRHGLYPQEWHDHCRPRRQPPGRQPVGADRHAQPVQADRRQRQQRRVVHLVERLADADRLARHLARG